MRVTMRWILLASLLILCACSQPAPGRPAETLDSTARVLVLGAFDAEQQALLKEAEIEQRFVVNGRTVSVGRLAGVPVVLAESGVSMVNAAMTTQAMLDRFNIEAIVFSGIAGGVNPDLHLGDVVVPAEWAQYQESYYARETAQGWDTGYASKEYANFEMVFPQPVGITSTAQPAGKEQDRYWFAADPELLALAESTAVTVTLDRCLVAQVKCLEHPPRIVTGGRGVSGQAFVDNAEYRQWIWDTFAADAVDMESAAVAHVAYANNIAFIAFRSLSDLAGGGAQENELIVFYSLAARNSARTVMAFLTAYASQNP